MKRDGRDCAPMSWIALGIANCFLLMLTLMPIGNAAFADTPPGNSAARWLSLAQLKEKWAYVSLDTIQRAGDGGDLSAEHYLGFCYAEGFRFEKNPSLGISYYERAAKAGYLPSWNNLGLLYQKGKIVPQDFAKAIYYYRLAAAAGLAQAQANLGFVYRDGVGVQRDPQEAMRWFQLAAAQGHAEAMAEIGRFYRFGNVVPKDLDTAKSWFEKGANNGSGLATFNLGLLYEQDEGDMNKAISFYRQAAEQGETEAMTWLYDLYVNGRGVPADEAEGVKWLTKAAEAGDAHAECLLGFHYDNPHWQINGGHRNRLFPANTPEALKWYRLSAAQGWTGGEYHLGLCYLHGSGVEQDEERGLELMRQAADQNLAYAEYDLAGLYARGIGEPRNEEDRPIALLKRVIKSDPQENYAKIKEAYDSLVFRYDYGVGTERDVFAAVECYCRAALAGMDSYTLIDKTNPIAVSYPRYQAYTSSDEGRLIVKAIPIPSERFHAAMSEYLKAVVSSDHAGFIQIGQRYLDGREVPKSAARAWLWFSLASRSGGLPNVAARISTVESAMTSTQVATVKEELPEMVNDFNSVAALLRGSRNFPTSSNP